MARISAIIFVLVTCLPFETVAQFRCSTVGVAGLKGCECNFLGACDVLGRKRAGTNILERSPKGLERYAHFKGSFGRNLAFLCEGNSVAILYDCNNRIPLYAATVVTGRQLSTGGTGRPRGSDGTFRESGTELDEFFQQNENDYTQSSKRNINYKEKVGDKMVKDEQWNRALNANPLLPTKLNVVMHKGHLIASMYGIGNYDKRKQTFVYTNAIPQFGDFNSVPWRTCEQRLITWGRQNCLNEKTPDGVRNGLMFIVVGTIPSTFKGRDPSKPRFFGSDGFSNVQDNVNFRVNVPSKMWTAACCTNEYTNGGPTYYIIRSTAFWRENTPGKFTCNRVRVDWLEEDLTPTGEERVNLFPFSTECRNKDNFVVLP